MIKSISVTPNREWPAEKGASITAPLPYNYLPSLRGETVGDIRGISRGWCEGGRVGIDIPRWGDRGGGFKPTGGEVIIPTSIASM